MILVLSASATFVLRVDMFLVTVAVSTFAPDACQHVLTVGVTRSIAESAAVRVVLVVVIFARTTQITSAQYARTASVARVSSSVIVDLFIVASAR